MLLMNAVTCGTCFIGSLHMNGFGGQTHIATYVCINFLNKHNIRIIISKTRCRWFNKVFEDDDGKSMFIM